MLDLLWSQLLITKMNYYHYHHSCSIWYAISSSTTFSKKTCNVWAKVLSQSGRLTQHEDISTISRSHDNCILQDKGHLPNRTFSYMVLPISTILFCLWTSFCMKCQPMISSWYTANWKHLLRRVSIFQRTSTWGSVAKGVIIIPILSWIIRNAEWCSSVIIWHVHPTQPDTLRGTKPI